MKAKICLITGESGFIGRFLIGDLLEENEFARIYNFDLRDHDFGDARVHFRKVDVRLPIAEAVEDFALLVVIGDGPELHRDWTLATNMRNIRILGCEPTKVLADYMARARASVFAAEEDFGITPVEAQACGTSVIAYGAGGVLETVVSSEDPAKRTGVFFYDQTPEATRDAVREFETIGAFRAEVCCANAERFSIDNFEKHLVAAVHAALATSRGSEYKAHAV